MRPAFPVDHCAQQASTSFAAQRMQPCRAPHARRGAPLAPCSSPRPTPGNHQPPKRQAACKVALAEGLDVAIHEFPAPAAGRFSADRFFFSEEHRIRGYEVAPDQRSNVVTIANLLQEAAGNHAVGMWGRTDMGFANVPSMKDLIFVMARLQIRMHQYPRWGDIVEVKTYFTEESRLSFRREWCVKDKATGTVLGAGTSTWVTINTATRRLSKVPEDVRSRFLRYAPPSTTCEIPPEETRKKLPDMAMPFQMQSPQQVARRSDMDMNGHINNATYLAWTLESMPQDVFDNYKLYEVELDFKAECKAGDSIEAHCNALPAVPPAAADNGHAAAPSSGNGVNGSARYFLHALQRCKDGACTELVRARTTWVPAA